MTDAKPQYRAVLLVVIILTGLALTASVGTAQPDVEPPAESALIIAFDEAGSGHLTLVVPFDLATEEERAAFESLRTNTSAQQLRAERFASRMRAVADRAEAETGRPMQISRPAIEFTERGNTGVIALSVTWSGLAVRSGDELVVTEPFASGVTLDRPLRLIAPDGFEVATVSPVPIDRSRGEATWAADESLDGFEARFVRGPTQTPTRDSDAAETGAEAPGFGIAIAVLALLLGTAFLRHRVRSRP